MSGQFDQFPELFTSAYPRLQFGQDVEPAPVLIAELVEAGTLRQQLSGTVKDAPPHRFRELFFAWTVKPDAGVVFDGPEPVPEREVVRVDVFLITPVTRQQATPYSRVIRYLAIVKQGRLSP